MLWLELIIALLAGTAAGFGWLIWRKLDRPQPPPCQTEAQEDIRLRTGLVNLLSYEIPQKEEP